MECCVRSADFGEEMAENALGLAPGNSREKVSEKSLKRGSGGCGPLPLKELQPLFPGVGAGSA